MTQPPIPTWDAERSAAPQRPRFASGLPAEDLIPRPRRVAAAFVLVLVAAAACAGIVALGAFDLDALRAALVDSLPAELRADYEQHQQETAASIMLGAVGGLGAVAAVAQVLAMRAIAVGRSGLSRVGYAAATTLQVLATLLVLVLRVDDPMSVVLAGVVLLGSLSPLVLVLTPRASRWLRQGEPQRSMPIAGAAS